MEFSEQRGRPKTKRDRGGEGAGGLVTTITLNRGGVVGGGGVAGSLFFDRINSIISVAFGSVLD